MAVMKREKGFTVIEVAIVVVVLIVLAVFFIIQRNGLEEASRDQERKTAINAMYYSLTEGFYAENGYYPRTISREQLPTVDPTLFTDPSGYTLEGDTSRKLMANVSITICQPIVITMANVNHSPCQPT